MDDKKPMSGDEMPVEISKDQADLADKLANDPVVFPALLPYATVGEQREAVEAWAREAIARGAGHDCGEWVREPGGTCPLCGRTGITPID